MPTKTKSNNSVSPARTIPPQAIEPLAKGLVGGLAGGMSAGMGELQQIKDEFKEKDFRSQKFGKKLSMLAGAGLRGFGAYQQGMLGGVSQGLLGTDFGLGSMGMLADKALKEKGQVIGVALKSFNKWGILHKNLTKLYLVNNLQKRKESKALNLSRPEFFD